MPRDVIPVGLKIEEEIAAAGIPASMFKLQILIAEMQGIEEDKRYSKDEQRALISPIYDRISDLEYAIMRSKPVSQSDALCLLMLAQHELNRIAMSEFNGEVPGSEEADQAVREALLFLMAQDRGHQELPASAYYMPFYMYGAVKPVQEAA